MVDPEVKREVIEERKPDADLVVTQDATLNPEQAEQDLVKVRMPKLTNGDMGLWDTD